MPELNTEILDATAGKSISLDDCIEAVLTAARKPQHYIKQMLTPETAPELFNMRTLDNKACIKIIWDDKRIMLVDMIVVYRQGIKIFTMEMANAQNKGPGSIEIPLKKRVWS